MFSVSQELIKRAQEGDKDAFGEIYKLFFEKIYRFIYFSVHNSYLAEDLTQETFLRAWKHFGSFKSSKGTIQAFIYAIARNLVIDWQRKKKPVSLTLLYDDEIKSNEDIEENFLRKQNQEMVWSVLSKLDQLDRHIVILRYFEELSFSQIAQITGEKEGSARVRLHRILKKLKQYLENKK